jgi:hypothetical protein
LSFRPGSQSSKFVTKSRKKFKFKAGLENQSEAAGLLGSLAARTSLWTLEWVCQATSGGAEKASPSTRFQPLRKRAGMFMSLVTGLWGTENTSRLAERFF